MPYTDAKTGGRSLKFVQENLFDCEIYLNVLGNISLKIFSNMPERLIKCKKILYYIKVLYHFIRLKNPVPACLNSTCLALSMCALELG